MRLDKKSLILTAITGLLVFPFLVKAADFDPSYLISDSEMTDYNSMSSDDIKNFLNGRAGTLNNYLTFDKEGNPKTAVQTFYEVAQLWKINPKYLMVLTQKEQSLLEDTTPTQKQYDWATGYGICDSCSMDDPTLLRFKGFYRQVNSAAAQTRYYMDNINEFNYKPGKTYTIDGQSVTLANTATAGLYNYTPHIAGGKSFWNIWTKFFTKRWPDGSLLSTSNSSTSEVYLISNNQKRLIASKAVFVSLFDPKRIILVPEADLNSYENGVPIKYLNFSILKGETSGSLFMIVNDTKRKIVSTEVFTKLGFNEDDVQIVPDNELAVFVDGTDITNYTVYPTGALIQSASAKKPYENLFYVISGEKRPILTKEIFDANFSGLKIKKVPVAELDSFMSGSNVVLPDGWLIKSKTAVKYKTVTTIVKKKKVYTKVVTNPEVQTVYVMSGGKKMPFVSGAVFSLMGYNTKNIKLISDETLKLISTGDVIAGN